MSNCMESLTEINENTNECCELKEEWIFSKRIYNAWKVLKLYRKPNCSSVTIDLLSRKFSMTSFH